MISLPLMRSPNLPQSDDDQEERERQARLALMGVHSRLAGGTAELNPNDPNYLPKMGRHITGMNLVSAHLPPRDASTTIPDQPNAGGASLEPTGQKPAGVMGKSSLMPRRDTPVAATSPSEPDALSPALMGAGMPPVMKPSRHASIEAGKREYEEGLPNITAEPGTPEYYAQRMGRMDYQAAHPWGSPISRHPGLFGKLAHIGARMGNIAGDVFVPGTMALIPETQLGREREYAEARRGLMGAERTESELMDARARMGEAEARMGAAPRERTVTIGGKPVVQQWERGRGWQTEPGIEPYKSGTQRTTPDEQLIQAEQTLANPAATAEEKQQAQSYIDAAGKARGILHPGQQRILTNPFEASIYGTPEQKKAAQDFLAFEKRIGVRYQRPTEFDERYRLFTEHPDIYKAMYGTKGGISTAEARMMLNYFDKRRSEINKDFTLSDADRQQELQEVEQLEQPFMEAAQRAAAPEAGTPQGDTVNVISPDGRPGTIPRANLQKALKRGYKLPLQGKPAQ